MVYSYSFEKVAISLLCFFPRGQTEAQTLASLFSVECLAGLRKDVIPQLRAGGYVIKSLSHYAS